MNIDSDYSDLDDDYNDFVPDEIKEKAKNIALQSMPTKSRQMYVATYNAFKSWRKENVKSNSFAEDVIVVYFDNLSQRYAPPSLWAFHSMLKATIKAFDDVDIGNYKKVTLFLKKKMSKYVAKKSEVFTKENLEKFLNEAPDNKYLATKVCLIFGISGALRRSEFMNMKLEDVKEIDKNTLFIKVPITKNNQPRSFTVNGIYYDYAKDYMAARPQTCKIDRFFLNYQNGRCTCQPIGINKFGSMPKTIAEFLKLENANKYTGHSFRRTSATLLADAGGDMTVMKRHGGWKSSTVVEGYIADSFNNKKRTHSMITDGIVLNKKTNTVGTTRPSTKPSPVITNVTALNKSTDLDVSTKKYFTKILNVVPVLNEKLIKTAVSMSKPENNDSSNFDKPCSSASNEVKVSTSGYQKKFKSTLQENTIATEKNSTSKFDHFETTDSFICSTVFYDPELGLCVKKFEESQCMVFQNCHFTIQVQSEEK